ncbi:MAG TPA: PKD domain-containing protein [Bacteroidales bacterium]|nr:PKD domain-containing protein [Bacteroidales bacterium]HRZ48257.1 PKD domain-containing protein [Bacteroidales bacterium]
MKTMKRTLTLMFLLLVATLAIQAQTTLTIQGTVTNLNALPLAGKQVHIQIDSAMGPILPFFYSNIVNTGTNGQFTDVVTIPQGVTNAMVYCWVLDCNNQPQYNFQWYVPNNPLPPMNLSICDSAAAQGCNSAFLVSPNPNSLVVSFTDQSAPSTGSNITSWLWSFGDSTISTQQNPSHTYAQPGTYTVCLTITDGVSCNHTSCQTIVVSNNPQGGCTAGFTAVPVAGTTAVTFTNTSSHLYMPAVYVATYTWSFGDGTTLSTLNYTPQTHAYPQTGTYVACITIVVTDIASTSVVCVDTFCTVVTAGGTPQPTGFLYGMLTAGSGAAGASEVYLIQHNTLLGTLTAIDTTYSNDSAGVTSYYFPNLQPGNYLVKAAMLPVNPNYAANMPTYHTSALFWNQATTVNVPANSYAQANISYIAGVNPGGPGFIGGLISQGANKGPGDPIAGVQVMLLDVNNGDKPVAVKYSDAQGAFGFSNIPYGTYKVYAEMLNKTTHPTVVTIDATHPSTDGIKIVVGSQVISGIETQSGADPATIGQLHPNPATHICLVPVTLTSGMNLAITLTDLTGRTLWNESHILPVGYTQLEIPVKHLPEGLYLINLEGDNGWKTTRKLIRQN